MSYHPRSSYGGHLCTHWEDPWKVIYSTPLGNLLFLSTQRLSIFRRRYAWINDTWILKADHRPGSSSGQHSVRPSDFCYCTLSPVRAESYDWIWRCLPACHKETLTFIKESLLQYLGRNRSSQICLWKVVLLTYLPVIPMWITKWTFRSISVPSCINGVFSSLSWNMN